ncbi:hypothetical protein KGV55_01415 [Candidatus Gracilibacteria bacterium]|nr:hypothetical protein [Candidatus Gracilibacteria bacterium]
MDRKQIQNRIAFITKSLKNPKLVESLDHVLPLFSEKELTQLLGFLESGEEKILFALIKEKIQEYTEIMERIKILKSKVKTEKIQKTEMTEKEKETKNNDILLTELTLL